jgi:hypothetical protein
VIVTLQLRSFIKIKVSGVSYCLREIVKTEENLGTSYAIILCFVSAIEDHDWPNNRPPSPPPTRDLFSYRIVSYDTIRHDLFSMKRAAALKHVSELIEESLEDEA